MFFHIYLDRNMQLHPRHFGPHLRDKLIAKLIQDVEGTCRYPPPLPRFAFSSNLQILGLKNFTRRGPLVSF